MYILCSLGTAGNLMSQLVLSIKNWGRGKERLETTPPVVNVPIHPSMDFTSTLS